MSVDNTSGKRKHKTLTLREKMDIIQRLEKRESPSQLAKEYGVGRATLHDIKKKKSKIMEHFEKIESVEEKRKTLKGGDYPEMETALFKWFLKERAKKKTITGDMIKVKAKELYEKIMKKDDFQASPGWLDKFKNRYGIRLQSNAFSNSIYAVQDLVQEKIRKLGLTPDQVYNANKNGFFWKMLPTNTKTKEEHDPLESKERITLMPCANATGKHKLELMVVVQSGNAESFVHIGSPGYYNDPYNADITKDMLTHWFHGKFIPGVQQFMRKSNLPEKALLILHDASGHLVADDLKSDDNNIQTMILPPNCNTALLPMSQIIQVIKSRYKKKLLLDIINQGGDLSQSFKEVNTNNVVFALAYTWHLVSASKIRLSWEKLWPAMIEYKVEGEEKEKADDKQEEYEEVLPIAAWSKLFAEKKLKINQKHLTTWLKANDDETEQQGICTEELVVVVIEEGDQEVFQKEPTVSSNEAVQCFSKCITWAEENDVSAEDIKVLKDLREKASKQGLDA